MKKGLLLTVVLMLGASMAFAQGGTIGIYKDTAGTNCWVDDKVPGLTPYYVVHLNTTAATALARIRASAGRWIFSPVSGQMRNSDVLFMALPHSTT